jgi:hypothetical protein
LPYAKVAHAAFKARAMAAIAIVNQKSWWRSAPGAAFHHLPHCPVRYRMSRHFEVEDFSVSKPNHEEDIKRLEQNRLDAEKIASPNVRYMVVLSQNSEGRQSRDIFPPSPYQSSRQLWLFFADWVLWVRRKSSCGGLYQSISDGRGTALRA